MRRLAQNTTGPSSQKLPPWWVDICSILFLFFLPFPLWLVWHIFSPSTPLGMNGFGLNLQTETHPIYQFVIMNLATFLGGLTGLFILLRRRFAYDFGIIYCIASLSAAAFLHWDLGRLSLPMGEEPENVWFHVIPIGLFLVHLVRHRSLWKKLTITKPSARANYANPSA